MRPPYRAWSILGNAQKLDGGAMFGNAPRAVWSRWMPPDDQNRIDLACRSLLLEDADGRRALFETGIGDFFAPDLRARYGVTESGHVLRQNLAALDIPEDSIDLVILSHLHFDHAGGLLTSWRPDAPPALLFPRATYLTSRQAWDRAVAPHPRDRASFIPELPDLLTQSGRLELIGGDHSPTVGPQIRFHLSHGHTPGLLLAEIPGDDGPVLYCGDLIPGLPWVHLPITMGYDRYPERLIDEKQALLDQLHPQNGRLFFTHDPHCALATITKDPKGRYTGTDPKPHLTGGVL